MQDFNKQIQTYDIKCNVTSDKQNTVILIRIIF